MAMSRVLQNVKGSKGFGNLLLEFIPGGGGDGDALLRLDDSLGVVATAAAVEDCNWDIKRLIMEVIKSLCNALAGI